MCSVSSPRPLCPAGAGPGRGGAGAGGGLTALKPGHLQAPSPALWQPVFQAGPGTGRNTLITHPAAGQQPRQPAHSLCGTFRNAPRSKLPGASRTHHHQRDGRTGRRDGAGQSCCSQRVNAHGGGHRESPVTAQPPQLRAVPRPRKGTARSSPSSLFHIGDHRVGQASQSETRVT